jgi:hypothetical protein
MFNEEKILHSKALEESSPEHKVTPDKDYYIKLIDALKMIVEHYIKKVLKIRLGAETISNAS